MVVGDSMKNRLVMQNNRDTTIGNPGDELIIVRAQNRILRLYRRLGRKGGWRAVVERLQRRLDPELLQLLEDQLVDLALGSPVPGTLEERDDRPFLAGDRQGHHEENRNDRACLHVRISTAKGARQPSTLHLVPLIQSSPETSRKRCQCRREPASR